MRLFNRLFGQKNGGGKPVNPGRSVPLSVEALEVRATPSHGFGLGAAPRPFDGLFGPGQFAAAVTGWAGMSSTSTLSATLTGATGTSGSVTFTTNASAGTNSLSVQVAGLSANTTYTVLAGTTTLGTLTTDANGAGTLSASNVSAAVSSGATITVADANSATVLSGTLAASSTGRGRGDCGRGGGASGLSAALTGAAGTSGTATFDVDPSTGTNHLGVQVAGLTAATSYTVSSGTSTLGTITTNASGSGTLSVDNTTAGLGTGSTITVTDPSSSTVLTGTLAAPTNPVTYLASTLSGANGTSGRVSYSANATTDTNSLLVRVSGLTANSPYTVLSGTATLGTVTTDANGNGALVASNVSASLVSGDTISVTDATGTTALSGTLAAATTFGPGHRHGFRG
jgi:hypothetical protein